MDERCQAEIRDLHRFFADWFLGTLRRTEEAFARVALVLAPGFEIVSPAGRLTEREALLEQLFDCHGSRAGEVVPFRIWTEAWRARLLAPGLVLASYQEWHDGDGGHQGRLATAILRERAETPHGVEWLHVHETALPEEGG